MCINFVVSVAFISNFLLNAVPFGIIDYHDYAHMYLAPVENNSYLGMQCIYISIKLGVAIRWINNPSILPWYRCKSAGTCAYCKDSIGIAIGSL